MDEVHYLISDASKKVDVEAHVLRYWEEELELDIPRNEMGHRYYTDLHIRLFKQVKNLKEKGYQLKAIKHALNQVLKKDGKAQGELSDEILERDMSAALKEFKEEDSATSLSTCTSGLTPWCRCLFLLFFHFFINREWLFYSTFNFLTTLIFVSLFLKKCVRMNLI